MEKLLLNLKKEGSELVRRILVYVVLNSFHLKMTPAQLRPTHVAVSPTHLKAVCWVSPPLEGVAGWGCCSWCCPSGGCSLPGCGDSTLLAQIVSMQVSLCTSVVDQDPTWIRIKHLRGSGSTQKFTLNSELSSHDILIFNNKLYKNLRGFFKLNI